MTVKKFSSKLLKKHTCNEARVVEVETSHGNFTTPCFMPVGTRAFVNHMTPDQLKDAGSQIILGGNTYHMLCSPGMDIIEKAGGMHRFMGWQGPMLTDSGGFQVFSLSLNKKICKIDEEGAHFKHPQTGQTLHLNADSSINAQKIIGADIIMAFDQCTAETGNRADAVAAMARTHRWLLRAKEMHDHNPLSAYGYYQALFGIIQGGSYRDLREESMRFILDLDMEGFGIGGQSIGFDMPKTVEIMQWLHPHLPENKIRYTMGLGMYPQDLLDAVAQGADIFDCVAPTRNARHGSLFAGRIVDTGDWLKFESEYDRGRILIKTAHFAKDNRPLMEDCSCYTCKNFDRAYLHFLFKQKSNFYCNLATIHNVHVMHEVCSRMRNKILE